MDRFAMVFIGGGAGALLRFVAGAAIMQRYGGRFPLGTFVINVTGSFAIGVLMTVLTGSLRPHPNWRLLLVVGFLGGYTTFSTFEFETYLAIRQSDRWLGVLNVVGSVIAGYLAVWLGAMVAPRN